jgi:hypothetical protein
MSERNSFPNTETALKHGSVQEGQRHIKAKLTAGAGDGHPPFDER